MSTDFKLQLLLIAKDGISAAASKAGEAMKGMETRLKGVREAAEKVGDVGKTLGLAGAGMLAASGLTVKAYADLESANAGLENATGTIYGQNAHLADLKKIVVELGNKYPGNSAMFTQLAESMLKAGMGADVLTSGALKGAGALQVMFHLDPATAGKQFVTMGNAMGIAGKDSMEFADTLQRLSYASGMTLDEISTAMPYMGEKLKAFGIQGLDSAKQITAVMGALKKGGVEGSMIGTSFEEFFKNAATIGAKERHIRGGLKVETFNDLKQDGIKLDFFDEKGAFRGMYQAIGELDKLKVLSQEKRAMVLEQLFGASGGRLAAVDMGNVKDMAQKMLIQEDIQKRLTRITETLSGRWEAAKGTFINLMATIGERIAPVLGPLLDKMNALMTAGQEWSASHPKLVGSLGILVTALGALLTVGGGVLYVGSKLVVAYTTMAPVFAGAAKFIPGLIGTFIKLAGATWSATAALVANTIASAKLYVEYIQLAGGPIKGLLMMMGDMGGVAGKLAKILAFDLGGGIASLWKVVVGFTAPLWGVITATWAWTVALLANPLTWIVLGIVALIAAIVALVMHWDKVKVAMGKVWEWMKGAWAGMKAAGLNIAKSIGEGIMAGINAPVEAIKAVVKRIRGFLPFSPAKEGPLMDIHRIKLVETIAEGVNPGALVNKMRTVAVSVRSTVPSLLAAGIGAAPMLAAGAQAQGQQRVSITIQIDARGAAPGVEQDVDRAVRAAIPTIHRELARLDAAKGRSSFTSR